MIDKVKKILTIILIAFALTGVVFSIIKIIISASKGVDIITPEEVCLYTVDANMQTNYSTFYYVDSCLKNLFEACSEEKYNTILNIYINDYKKEMQDSEKIEILKSFATNAIKKSEERIEFNYTFEKLYNASEKYNEYIAEVTIGEKTYYLLISLEDNKQYSYRFAFLK